MKFRQRLGNEQAFIVTGNCSLDGQQTPFLPFIEGCEDRFRCDRRETEAEYRAQARAGTYCARVAFHGKSGVANLKVTPRAECSEPELLGSRDIGD